MIESAQVRGQRVNCGSSRDLRTNLDSWVLDLAKGGPTVIHLNAGSHDVRRIPEDDWEVQVPLREYRDNMAAILDRLLAHSEVEQILLATTTPVNEERHRASRYSNRLNTDNASYNRVLAEIAASQGVAINDLWAAVVSCPFEALSADGVHLNDQGGAYVAQRIAAFLKGSSRGPGRCP